MPMELWQEMAGEYCVVPEVMVVQERLLKFVTCS